MTIAEKFPEDRVRHHTAPEVNARIDSEISDRVRLYAHADDAMISRRLTELDREWDMERLLQTNAASLVLTGTVLGVAVSKKWLIIPLVVSGFLLQHAIQGWCPPIVPFRQLGVRTRMEIEKERYALKLLRGDFGELDEDLKLNVERLLAALER
jgi:hypothetical protein